MELGKVNLGVELNRDVLGAVESAVAVLGAPMEDCPLRDRVSPRPRNRCGVGVL